eukprot:scaffold4.g4572.t1
MARVRHKSKEEALDACAEQHLALVTCFKSCNLVSAFTGCCTAEHKAFWDCFTRERGTNETKITSYLNSVFGGGGGSGQIGGSATASAGQGLEAKDHFLPSSVEFFMQHSSLCLVTDSGRAGLEEGWKTLAPQARHLSLLCPALAGWLAGCRHTPSAFCHYALTRACSLPAWRWRRGAPLAWLDDVPLYAHVKSVHGPGDAAEAVEALEINYCTFYPHNGRRAARAATYRVAGVVHTGSHDGDWEHLTARVHPQTGALIGIYFNAHRSRDGCWVPAEDVPLTADGRPIVFVAKHGHGCYPRAGRVLRGAFFANDLCRADGPVWRPRRVVLVPNTDLGYRVVQHSASGAQTASGEAAAAGVAALADGMGGLAMEDPQAARAEEEATAPVPEQQEQQEARAPASNSGEEALQGQRRRLLMPVRSRGSLLCGPPADAPPVQPQLRRPNVEVVTDDPCCWVWFRGDWGETAAPIAQGWWSSAETPLQETRVASAPVKAMAFKASLRGKAIARAAPVARVGRKQIITQAAAPLVGSTAPDFSATAVFDQEFVDVKLSQYRGKYVVLFFYPLDFTASHCFVCPTEITAFSDRYAEFAQLNTEILGVSVDSQFSHLAWIQTDRKSGGLGDLKYPLVADLTKSISDSYGGVVQHATINNLAFGRSVDETLRTLQALQYVQANPDEVCPAGWKPGSKTMKPDPEGSKEYFAAI